jgi:hypothetical protein
VLDVGTDFTINNRINTNLIFKTSNTEKMRITNSGNVGIGTTSPTEKLEVSGNILIDSIGQELQFSNHSVGAYRDGSNRLMISGYGGIRFQAEAVGGMENQATRMVINPSGNVGIGTISPVAKLHVKVNDSGATPIAQQHLIVENNSATGIGILTPSATSGYLFFGDNNDAQRGFISYDHSSDSMAFKVSGSERMRIDSSGSVGIGTTSPSNKLHVNSGSTNEVARFESTDSVAYLSIMDNNTTYSLQGIGSIGDALTLYNNNSEKIRINSSGDVGIGTNSPLGILHVADANPEFILEDTTNLNRNKIENVDGNMRYHADYGSNIGNSRHIFFIDNSEKVRFDTNGNVGIGNTSPSDNLEIGTNGSADTAFRMYSDQSGKYFRINSGGNFTALRTTGDQNLIIQSSGTAGYVTFEAGNSERMRVNYNGNVGIGTTSPAFKTTIYSSGTTDSFPLVVGQGNEPNEFVGIGLSGFTASNGAVKAAMVLDRNGTYGVGDIHFLNNTTQDNTNATLSDSRLVIRKSGNVGIGTTGPASKLAVDGGDIEVDDSASGLILRSPNGTRYRIQVDNSGNLTTTAV